MRVLLLLRGSAGCGKSTWIEQNGLKPYAISADEIRMMCSSPALGADGKEFINPANDMYVWDTLYDILERRMRNGDFTVVDATNSKTSEMNKYKNLCEKYKYRIYCVDFTDIPIEETKRRNKLRPEIKQVPEEAIDRMYSRFETQKIPSGITAIKPNELEKIWLRTIDLSEYKAIHHIGDIHGCYTALKEYIDTDGGLKDDEFYIFLGDYIDRGLENVEVLKFLMSIYNNPNVMLLEGNHERWLQAYGNGRIASSKEFELVTKSQLEQSGIDKKEIRKFYRRMGQCAYYTYKGKTVLASHGGLSKIPECLTLLSTSTLIRGAGNYKDSDECDACFAACTSDNVYQIHGHRNVRNSPIQVNEKVFNLEGGVEMGGCLRCVKLTENGFETVEVKNKVFKDPAELIRYHNKDSEIASVGDLVLNLRKSRYVIEKQFGNISSFNFTREAFYDKVWNGITTRARGLFINIPKQKIVARAYNKFFNINEREETKLDVLQHTLQFPVKAYVKENGFLGLVSYNEETDSLFFTSKSDPEGDFSGYLKSMFYKTFEANAIEHIKLYTKTNNVTLVFECVDMENDPHIIEYPESRLFLLDIVKNTLEFQKAEYHEMSALAAYLGVQCKEFAEQLESWEEFYNWYESVNESDYNYNGRKIEGFVIEDASGYMVKMKLTYYNFWKFMRSISHEAIRKGYIEPKRTSALITPLANQYYGWVKTLHDADNVESIPKDICTLRKMFYETEEGKKFILE